MTWASKEAAPMAGSFLESEATLPRRMSLTDTFLTLKPTLSPGRPSVSCSWCISTDLTSVVTPAGAKVTTMPGFRVPVSIRPTGTVPIPPILYTSWRGRRRVLPVDLPALVSFSQPLYQGQLVEGANMLSPLKPEMGTKGTVLGL